jgi:hypothetical protein
MQKIYKNWLFLVLILLVLLTSVLDGVTLVFVLSVKAEFI